MTRSNKGEINLNWAREAVNILAHSGVRHSCLSPGSRNTPLTLAFIEHPLFKCTSHFDERSAGYFALGFASASGFPAVLCCTSGTAAANYFPAIVEANYGKIPLIVITADRPEKLVGTGANQTIHQQDLFGEHVRFFRHVGEPDLRTLDLNQFIVSAISMAIGINSKGEYINPPGPVHLNFPFDEPLHPVLQSDVKPAIFDPPKLTLPSVIYSDILPDIDLLSKCKRPLIVCGRLQESSQRDEIFRLSDHINSPVFADISSQLRFGNDRLNLICHYDLFLKYQSITPDLVIRFGAKPTSKILSKKLDEWKDYTILVDPAGRFNDDCPKVIPCRISTFTNFLIEHTKRTNSEKRWLETVRGLEVKTQNIVKEFLSKTPLFEGSIAATVQQNLKNGDRLFLGNSMPIRDADMFCGCFEKDVRVCVNRGASGIDGCTSTAAGIAYADFGNGKSTNTNPANVDPMRRVFLITGDLSFLYDLNALFTSQKYRLNLTVIVINNGGGGIFSLLPIANYNSDQFDEFWTVPHQLSIRKIAEVYNCEYFSANSIEKIGNSIASTRKCSGPAIIEIQIDQDHNVNCHARLRGAIRTT
ncbi:MAG: 2-succinyl-5-enolpyruvyl-6-hydroxy-3-cyclohexene-1-carboxylic-acid synthase, partial [Fidelibacterota bacterium]